MGKSMTQEPIFTGVNKVLFLNEISSNMTLNRYVIHG